MIERKIYTLQPGSVLSLAVPPDHKQIALGRYDGRLLLLDEATGKVQSEPLPAKPKPPVLIRLTPNWGQRGRTIRVTFDGKYLEGASKVVSTYARMSARLL